jgi:hypothetical protein
MSKVEGMYSIYFIKKGLSEAIPSFDIRHSTFCGSLRFAFNFMKFHKTANLHFIAPDTGEATTPLPYLEAFLQIMVLYRAMPKILQKLEESFSVSRSNAK